MSSLVGTFGDGLPDNNPIGNFDWKKPVALTGDTGGTGGAKGKGKHKRKKDQPQDPDGDQDEDHCPTRKEGECYNTCSSRTTVL